jgi:hypothetical protein
MRLSESAAKRPNRTQQENSGAAKEGRIGKILQSNGGTLFLDEIGDMPLMLPTRLLRVLEEREIVPLGSEHTIPVDLHVISATHRDVRLMIENGEFREDLFYRLNGITLHLPLLRDRGDKPALIESLLLEENPSAETVEIADDAFAKLLGFSCGHASRRGGARFGEHRGGWPGVSRPGGRAGFVLRCAARGGARGAAPRTRQDTLEHQPYGSRARHQQEHPVSQDAQTRHRPGRGRTGPVMPPARGRSRTGSRLGGAVQLAG